ncbi:hypothetical protein JCM10908_004499 [Rhodotorula pacifica]|uniref:uncharacterized protein n=1 Tax=Rhodotorula pacifica TaxID=1495444 RepID=UPI00317232E2
MYNSQPPPPSYSHYQPPPQPITMPPASEQPAHHHLPHRVQQPFPALGMAPGTQQQPRQPMMGVGNQSGDFQLFPEQQQQSQPRPIAVAQTTKQGYTIPIPSSGSSSESSSIGDGDYPPVPELVADDANAPSPPVSFSPPSPKSSSAATTAAPPVRPGLLPHSTASKGSQQSAYGRNGSYTGFERASSVPAPECPRPMRRKTQESRDWPSFYSSSSSSSSSMSSAGGGGGGSYLQTPGLTDSKPLVVDEPASFITPTVATAGSSNPFDVSSFALSPAAQYPFLSYSASPPYPDHPLLPSEQSDLLDRVRRDLLDVDLSSIKGPLRALALSGAESSYRSGPNFNSLDRETTPTQFNGGAASTDAMLSSSSPNAVQWQYPLVSTTPRSSGAAGPAQHLLRSPATSASDATVSPQEAFLDYDEVDSRLHDPSRPRGSEFVGAGASLFASLPVPAADSSAARSATHSPNLPTYAAAPVPTSLAQSTAALTLSPPSASGATGSSTPASPRATSPRAAHAHGHGHHRRGPHPFSVPQNAVTWAEKRSRSGQRVVGSVLVGGDAADDDGDFGPESAGAEDADVDAEDGSTEEEAKPVEEQKPVENKVSSSSSSSRGGFAAPRPAAAADSVVKEEVTQASDDREDIKPFLVGKTALPPTTTAFNPLLPLEAVSQSVARGGFPGFAPPPPPSLSAGPPPAGMSAFQQELARQRLSSEGGGDSGTATPRRAAAATALAGLGDALHQAPLQSSSDASSGLAPPRRPQRQRKRSRIAMSAYGDSDAEEDVEATPAAAVAPSLGFAAPPKAPIPSNRSRSVDEEDDSVQTPDADGESDESYRSSGSSFGANKAAPRRSKGDAQPPNKRRRRAPASGSTESGSNAPVSSGGIVCNHQNSDGSICGVIFRRPYDLARHKETIHGEGLKGEKVKAKEWRCEECGGTFSRKDALLRHGRIRGHVTG